MTSDSQRLLVEFTRTGSETAFRELVMRYTDLVYSVATRLMEGNTQLAQDVTQTVFIDLARLASQVPAEVMLGGWLHRRTCFVAATALRGERRRHSRERLAVEMNALHEDSQTNLASVTVGLDEAINHLGDEDRTAIVLRFFERSDFRSVGNFLGVSEDAARMRVTRAVEKLRVLLKQRGATLSVAALGTFLASEAVTAAPAGLAASLCATNLAATATGSGPAATFLKIMTITKIKAGLVGVLLVAGIAAPLTVHRHAQSEIQKQQDLLRQQAEQLSQLTAENEHLSNLLVQAPAPGGQDQRNELLKLRGEIGVLNRKLAAAKSAQEQAQRAAQAQAETDTQEQQKQIGIAKLNYAKAWTLAFWQYASQNQGQVPTDFDQALSFLPETAKNYAGLSPDQYEITYQGSLNALTNPQSIIVLREKEPVQDPDGGAHRAYGFADGHSEIHKARDGNFQPWEQQHLAASPTPVPPLSR